MSDDFYGVGPMKTDATTERMRQETGHHCIACPSDVRNLMATAENALNALDAAKNGGDWSRLYRKMESLRTALGNLKPVSDEHFEALNGWRRP
jgi:hypothetical protein